MASLITVARLAGPLVLAALLPACQTAREQEAQVKPQVAHAYLADKPAELKKHFLVTLTQGPRNQVLNDMRLGLASMELGDTALAEHLFDDALAGIETVYADNPEAAKARGLFTRELSKDFKGEPYERAMAYYYRGLLYMRAGDYDNARASFKGGFIQDSFAEEDQNRADFGLLQFLQGWASRCRGNTVTAEEDFKDFKAINDKLPLPADSDNTLVLVETGSAPVKYSQGDSASSKPKYLKFRRTGTTETARLSIEMPKAKGAKPAVRTLALPQIEDIYFQAATRGGREFDSILAGKTQFKAATSTVGDIALTGAAVAGAVAMETQNSERQRDAAVAAGALLLVGLLAKGVSEATEAEADTRYWDNLPDRVYAVTLPLPETVSGLSVDFLADNGTLLRTREVTVTRSGACGLAWVRGQSALPANPRAPNSAPHDAMFAPVIIPTLDELVPPGAKPVDDVPKPSIHPET